MFVACKKILAVLCFFTVSSSAVAAVTCLGDASCIDLRNCTGLYKSIQSDVSTSYINLYRELHCGFENGHPLVCCPPALKDSITTERKTEFNPVDLLPDLNVCGIQNNVLRVQGSWVELDEHPWLALLQLRNPVGSGFPCGGVLISSKYVLTAAHCVSGDFLKFSRISHVRLGEWNLTSEPDCYYKDCSPPVLDVPIEGTIVHANYTFSDDVHQNDIALLRLARKVNFTDYVKPICLPISSELRNISYDDSIMEVAGWGIKGLASNVMLKGHVPVMNYKKCKDIYIRMARSTITEKQFCGGGSGIDGLNFCIGDSGGPLIGLTPSSENLMVTGVASYGPSLCSRPDRPRLFTRVTAYMDWILSKIRP